MNTPWTFDGEEILDCRGAKVITAHAEFIGAGEVTWEADAGVCEMIVACVNGYEAEKSLADKLGEAFGVYHRWVVFGESSWTDTWDKADLALTEWQERRREE